jgi:hypothetical protein
MYTVKVFYIDGASDTFQVSAWTYGSYERNLNLFGSGRDVKTIIPLVNVRRVKFIIKSEEVK